MKSTCISHPVNEPLIIVRQWQLDFCDNDTAAAALLSFFEYWHNIKTESAKKNRQLNLLARANGDDIVYDTSLFQWHTQKELSKGLMNIATSPKRIKQALDRLVGKGAISVHSNPNDRYRFDKTKYFIFYPDVVNNWLTENNRTGRNSGNPITDTSGKNANVKNQGVTSQKQCRDMSDTSGRNANVKNQEVTSQKQGKDLSDTSDKNANHTDKNGSVENQGVTSQKQGKDLSDTPGKNANLTDKKAEQLLYTETTAEITKTTTTTTTPPAVVVAVTDKKNDEAQNNTFEELRSLIPQDVRMPGIEALIKNHLTGAYCPQKNFEYIRDQIAYTNQASDYRKHSGHNFWMRYRSYLGKALDFGYGTGFYADAAEKRAKEKAREMESMETMESMKERCEREGRERTEREKRLWSIFENFNQEWQTEILNQFYKTLGIAEKERYNTYGLNKPLLKKSFFEFFNRKHKDFCSRAAIPCTAGN